MILKLIEIISRYYYKVYRKLDSYTFIEKKITPLNENSIFLLYYFYIFCYYIEKLFNVRLNLNHNKQIKYYEVIYNDNNIQRATIINGTINDIFQYTRYDRVMDKSNFVLKYNYIKNNEKTNIRNIIKKYDTKTKLYNIIHYNFYKDLNTNNDTENGESIIEIEIGNKIYNVKEMNKNLLVEDA
jgi:hypothetical protein